MSLEWSKSVLLSMKANRVPVVMGPPGIGKSWEVQTIHNRYWGGDPSAPFVTVMASLSDPTTFCGIEYVTEGVTRRTVPAWAQRLLDAGKGTLFLDEATLASPATWTALLRVVLDRVVGDVTLPESVRVILAANPVEMTNAGCELPPAGANRLVHLSAEAPSPRAWADWIEAHNAGKGEAARTAAALVGAFIANKADPSTLLNVPKDESKRAGAWPSPRSWHAATDCLAVALAEGEQAFADLVSACVGSSAGGMFATFAKHADLPKARDVLLGTADPKLRRERPDRAAAILRAVSSEAVNGPAVDKSERSYLVEQAWHVAKSACELGLPDIALNHTASLTQWRILKSGSPSGASAVEKEVSKLVQTVAKASL
jgi:hypothetical protein